MDTHTFADHSTRLARLRDWIAGQGLDGMILTTADAFQNEDAPEHDRDIAWLTGFTGSLAHALVMADGAVFLVDGRYGIQAQQEVDGADWTFGHIHDAPLGGWLRDRAAGCTIGYDPMRWSVAQMQGLRDKAGTATLTPCDDPFDAVWSDRPAMPQAPVRALPEAEAGRSAGDKLQWLAQELDQQGAGVWVETRPDNIAWLFNMRGGDVAMNPLPLSFATVTAEGAAHWFIDPAKCKDIQPEGVTLHPIEAFLPWLKEQTAACAFDPAFTPDAVEQALGESRHAKGIVTIEKALKSRAELDGFRRAHLDDAVAMAHFGHWLSEVMQGEALPDETAAAVQLEAFRAKSEDYQEPSFVTIAATGGNAAMCHYHPPAQGSARLARDAVFLCDSGGQYTGGTTDVTRTYAFAPVSAEVRRIATAVLRGFIALSRAQFPDGTMPHQIDALARAPLWEMGLDYDHGTGHNVGHNLLVHEHPHRIGQKPNPFALRAGHVLTLEPGFYEADVWGIRVENQVEVVARDAGFIGFDAMTLVPIDLGLYDLDTLDAGERDWIDSYHAQVREAVAPLLSGAVREWLIAATAPLDQRAPQVSDKR
ncbi:aminopeptidase P family protein [Thalassorhabdomicrobium marinisediminis]|uniref:Aminopeptidase P family protein n=1 Tax=Thalassorhabdomicrobium marinisediminis TaxID=2170577 RepID=A0A2T7FTT3_9RHOB|nr:aminopeptidase P family protein [Thalassorhabdomicrobium marinisediminis]PVA05552.1 aminopeptidase P family protein [Thalassorhabdomicrobium marinisediminis]